MISWGTKVPDVAKQGMPRRLEPSRSTKSGGKAQGVGFRGPSEEATMARAGQPFQEHLMGRDIQDLLCHGEAPDLVS